MSVRIAIHGIAGRMGRRISALAASDPEIDVVGAVERDSHSTVSRSLRELGIAPVDCTVTDDVGAAAAECDVMIDFTLPAASLRAAEAAGKAGCALVAGTTGFTAEQYDEFGRHTSAIASIHAPNMSVGVNLLFAMVGDVTRRLGPGYDIEIVEMHHHHKVDAPSGTAVRLAELIAAARGVDLGEVAVYGRSGRPGERPAEQIGIHALRGGSVAGDHRVIFASPTERVELVHHAESRDTFAAGALCAAKFLAGRAPGSYTMQDVLDQQ